MSLRGRGAVLSSVVGVAFSCADVLAQSSFRVLEPMPEYTWFVPKRISGDGSVVFGSRTIIDLGTYNLMRWTEAGGYEDLGRPATIDYWSVGPVSRDADACVIQASNEDKHVPPYHYRWTLESGFQPVPLPLGPWIRAVSDGGTIMCGEASDLPIAWGPDGVPFSLDLPAEMVGGSATDLSEDGSTIVGYVYRGEGRRDGVIWRLDGSVSYIPQLNFARGLEAQLVSRDGGVIVGITNVSGTGTMGFRWTGVGEPELMVPRVWGAGFEPRVLSGDGDVVYATYRTMESPFYEQVIWTPGSGMIPLWPYLESRGVKIPDWIRWSWVVSASDDGKTFVAEEIEGERRVVIVTLDELPPARCRADWNMDGTVNSADFFEFVAGFLGGAADFNGSGQTNSQDFFDFLAAFFAGCG